MKRFLTAVSAVCMLLAITVLITGCRGGSDEITEISIWFMGGSADNQDAAVVEAANARLAELGLDIAIRPVWTGGWGMGEPAQIALNTADASVDIFWTGSWGLNYFTNARVGNFIRLDDPGNNLLERYGRELRATVQDNLWDAFMTDGPEGFGLYGIPGPKDHAAWFKLDVNNTRLAELGFNFDDIFDMNGSNHDFIFDPVFVEIMEASQARWGSSFFPLNLEAGNFAQNFAGSDGDLTGLAVFMWPFDPLDPTLPVDPEIGLQIENERFLRVLDRLRYFWERGFIDPRLAIPGEAMDVISAAHSAGEYLFSSGQYAYGHTAAMVEYRGIDVRYVPLSIAPLISTMSAAGSGFAISVFSPNPEAAMQFLNAWYTDTTLATILTEGVEGYHWHFVDYTDEAGTVHRLVEHLPARAGNYGTWRFGMGNIFTLSPRVTDGPGYFARFEAYNARGIATSTLGFSFDPEPVEMQMAALTAVVNEWRHTLTIGAIDPAEAVPAYLAALRANGIDAVLEELNRQLRAFYAARR